MVVLSKVRSIGVNKVFVDDQINNVNRETERLNKQSWEAEVVVTPQPLFLLSSGVIFSLSFTL